MSPADQSTERPEGYGLRLQEGRAFFKVAGRRLVRTLHLDAQGGELSIRFDAPDPVKTAASTRVELGAEPAPGLVAPTAGGEVFIRADIPAASAPSTVTITVNAAHEPTSVLWSYRGPGGRARHPITPMGLPAVPSTQGPSATDLEARMEALIASGDIKRAWSLLSSSARLSASSRVLPRLAAKYLNCLNARQALDDKAPLLMLLSRRRA